VRGHAFMLGEEAEGNRLISVAKQWVTLEGRTFLVEEIPFSAVDEQIQALSRGRQGASIRQDRKGQGQSVLTALKAVLPRRTAQKATGRMRMARLQQPATPSGMVARTPGDITLAALNVRKAFVLDYTILTSQSGFTFACNTNYYVSGTVTLSGTTTIEGGTVIKFTNAAVGKITLSGPLVCQTDMYRPAVLTSRNDNTVGETISGSTGSPSNAGAGTYLDSTFSNPSNSVRYLRVSYAGTALSFDGLTNGVWHSQFVNCSQGINSYNQKPVRLYNVLMAVSSNCIVNSTNIRGEHLTVNVCSNLVSATSPSLALTNSILVTAQVDLTA